MKALTFKKSALAAALLASTAANAAQTLKVGELTNATVQTNAAAIFAGITDSYHLHASQEVLSGTDATIAASDDVMIAMQAGATALSDNDLVTFNFTNGGLDASKTYKLAMGKDDGDIVDLATIVYSATASNGVVSQITFRVNNATAAESDANDVFFLVQSDFVDSGADQDNNLDYNAGAGVTVLVNEGASEGAALTASASIDYTSALATDVASGTVNIARIFDGINFTAISTKAGIVDFNDDALEFTEGKVLTTGAMSLSKVANSGTVLESKYDWDNDGTVEGSSVNYTINTGRTPVADTVASGAETAEIKVVADNCDAIETFKVGGSTVTKSTTEACTWEKAIADTNTVEVTVDGETTLSDNTFAATYTIKHGTDTDSTASNTLMTWSTDVQSNDSVVFPYLTAFNNNASTWSYIKVDNRGNSKDLVIAVKGTLEEPLDADADEITFNNYYLKTIAAGELANISGDDIIDALVTPMGSEEEGFKTTALEGVDKSKLYHMSVTLQSVNTSTATLGNAKFEALNSSGSGRTQINKQ
jgi:hypothetical protein